jgi:Tfp pilus assembly major pilin PilA
VVGQLRRRSASGFNLVDVIRTIAVVPILAAVSVPAFQNVTEAYAHVDALREVEGELKSARLKSVSANRSLQVRFNSPAAGQYRTVDNNPLTRPNHDGPIRRLPTGVTFGAATALEFWPDGTVHQQQGTTIPWPAVGAAGASITIVKNTVTRRIDVNGVGNITLVP